MDFGPSLPNPYEEANIRGIHEDYHTAERQKEHMKRGWEDAVLCHEHYKFPRLTASERIPRTKSPSHEAVVLLRILRNVTQLVPGCNNTNIST